MQVYWEQFGWVKGLKDLSLFLLLMVLQIPPRLLWSGSVFSHRLCHPSFCDLTLKTLHSEILASVTSSWNHALLWQWCICFFWARCIYFHLSAVPLNSNFIVRWTAGILLLSPATFIFPKAAHEEENNPHSFLLTYSLVQM